MRSWSPEADPILARALPIIEADLARRYPRVPVERVQHHLSQASTRAAQARVRDFLPILVERWAEKSLRTSERETTEADVQQFASNPETRMEQE